MIHVLTYLFKYLIIFPFMAIALSCITISALLLWDKSYLILVKDLHKKIEILMGVN